MTTAPATEDLDVDLCDVCSKPEEPGGDPLVDCLNVGPVHVGGCHAARCDSRVCREYLGAGDDLWVAAR